MIFTFWISDIKNADGEQSLPPSIPFWREQYPDTKVYSDADAIALLAAYGPTYVDLYRRIRIPACKSDLARLLLLHEYGGLYVDSHAGPGNRAALPNVLNLLKTHELVLFDKTWEHRHEEDTHLINSAICARQGSPVVKMLIDSALKNLLAQDNKENQSKEYVPYNIFTITGAWDISVRIFDLSKRPAQLKPEFADKISIFKLVAGQDPGFFLYKYYGYRKEGSHWSERQAKEPLFLPQS